jgi:hypothetical protein
VTSCSNGSFTAVKYSSLTFPLAHDLRRPVGHGFGLARLETDDGDRDQDAGEGGQLFSVEDAAERASIRRRGGSIRG